MGWLSLPGLSEGAVLKTTPLSPTATTAGAGTAEAAGEGTAAASGGHAGPAAGGGEAASRAGAGTGPQHTLHTPLPSPGLPAHSCCLHPCSPKPFPPSFPTPRFLLSFLASLFLSVFSHPSTPNPGSLPSSCLCAFIPHLFAHLIPLPCTFPHGSSALTSSSFPAPSGLIPSPSSLLLFPALLILTPPILPLSPTPPPPPPFPLSLPFAPTPPPPPRNISVTG